MEYQKYYKSYDKDELINILVANKQRKEELVKELAKYYEEIERLKEVINGMIDNEEKYNLEIIRLNNIINELEKCVQNYIYAIEPRGCSINYNCEYDSEEDYINAMKEQSKLNTFKFILNKIKELKGEDKNVE